jgi:hypothetical protein
MVMFLFNEALHIFVDKYILMLSFGGLSASLHIDLNSWLKHDLPRHSDSDHDRDKSALLTLRNARAACILTDLVRLPYQKLAKGVQFCCFERPPKNSVQKGKHRETAPSQVFLG